ncbi:MAG TPA: homocysteine S-methyltransferase family protein [Gemmataceae bacterium]|nr:homocysteine S-methyltransferase family protein [Gemmataceae bacterium]
MGRTLVNDFVQPLRSGRILVMDGAMGTELQRLHASPESIHSSYVTASADVLLTNTFQTHDPTRLHAEWRVAIRAAREAKPRFLVAGVGPVPNLTPSLASAILAECRDTDGVVLETWTSFVELEIFAKARPSDLPMLVSFTFLHDGLATFAGASPGECARVAEQHGAIAIGANCGKDIDMDDMRRIVERYRSTCALPIFVRPNAGTPRNGVYPRSPTTMAAQLPALLDAGVTMIGGCCGTTPEHIRAFREVVDRYAER